MKKIYLSILLAAAGLLNANAAWDGTAASSFAGGTGTAVDPYLISSESQLAYLASTTNQAGNLTNGKYYKLTSDLDLSGGSSWTPIGKFTGNVDQSYYFLGNFDGNNHIIRNMTINTSSFTDFTGLFGKVGDDGTSGVAAATIAVSIRNLGLVDFNITVASNNVGKRIGGICGIQQTGSTNASANIIEDCFATGTITLNGIPAAGVVQIGGFSGRTKGVVRNCYTKVNVNLTLSSTATANQTVNQINTFAGGANATITNCYSTGAVTLNNGTSGFTLTKNTDCFNFAATSLTTIANCYTSEGSSFLAGTTASQIAYKTPVQLQDVGMAALLSNHYATHPTSGTPVLSWQLLSAPVASTAVNVTPNSFDAIWNAVAGASTYLLDVATDNSFTQLVSGYNGLSVSAAATSQTVSGLTPSTTYYYRVRTSNEKPSANSNVVSVTTELATDATQVMQDGLRVTVANGAVRVANVSSYAVYSTTGAKVADVKNNTAATVVKLNSGLYVITTGVKAQKVLVK